MEIAVGGQSMSFDKKDITVIICCAGMGTRLGIGTTKALVDIAGEPLIIRELIFVLWLALMRSVLSVW